MKSRERIEKKLVEKLAQIQQLKKSIKDHPNRPATPIRTKNINPEVEVQEKTPVKKDEKAKVEELATVEKVD